MFRSNRTNSSSSSSVCVLHGHANYNTNLSAVTQRNNYANTHDIWSDSQMRSRLVENGYMRTDAQVGRDELVKLSDDKLY